MTINTVQRPSRRPVIPEIVAAMQNDPRYMLGQGALAAGTSSAPVPSALAGLARALQAPLGAYMMKKAGKRYGAKEDEYRAEQQANLARVLGVLAPEYAGVMGGTTPQTAPGVPQMQPQAPPVAPPVSGPPPGLPGAPSASQPVRSPGMQDVANAVAAAQNPVPPQPISLNTMPSGAPPDPTRMPQAPKVPDARRSMQLALALANIGGRSPFSFMEGQRNLNAGLAEDAQNKAAYDERSYQQGMKAYDYEMSDYYSQKSERRAFINSLNLKKEDWAHEDTRKDVDDAWAQYRWETETFGEEPAGGARGVYDRIRGVSTGTGGALDPKQYFKEWMIPHEGGYNPADSNGAPVKYGINGAYNKNRLPPGVSIKDLTAEQAADIFTEHYWKKSGAADLAPDLAAIHADTFFMNEEKASEILEQSGGDPGKYLELRQQFLDGLVKSNPKKYGRYEKTWRTRTQDLAKYSARLGGGSPRRTLYARLMDPSGTGAGNTDDPATMFGDVNGRRLDKTYKDNIAGGSQIADVLGSTMRTFNPDYVGQAPIPGAQSIEQYANNWVDPDEAIWWKNYSSFVNDIRHEKYGAALTAQEKVEFEKEMAKPTDSPEVALARLKRQREIVVNAVMKNARAAGRAGYNAGEIYELVGNDLATEWMGKGGEQGGKPQAPEGSKPVDQPQRISAKEVAGLKKQVLDGQTYWGIPDKKTGLLTWYAEGDLPAQYQVVRRKDLKAADPILNNAPPQRKRITGPTWPNGQPITWPVQAPTMLQKPRTVRIQKGPSWRNP